AKQAQVAAALPGAVTLSGQIQAQHVTLVGAPVEGTVEEFLAEVGDEVFQGQLLARISNTGLEAAHEKAKLEADRASARLDRLEAELSAARLEASRAAAERARARTELDRTRRAHDRQKLLYGEGATPRLTFERAEREFTSAETSSETSDEVSKAADSRVAAIIKEMDGTRRIVEDKNRQLEDAQSQLEAEQVLSPVDGIVVGRRGLAGDAVKPDVKDLFQIAADLGLLSVTVSPDPNVAAALRPGMPATIQIGELGGEALSGAVTAMAGNKATIEFTSPTPLIKPGMTASVRIELR
ncbi:MAG: hypothetical protein ABFD86_23005, partial [Bryobacteraceae bacterium]